MKKIYTLAFIFFSCFLSTSLFTMGALKEVAAQCWNKVPTTTVATEFLIDRYANKHFLRKPLCRYACAYALSRAVGYEAFGSKILMHTQATFLQLAFNYLYHPVRRDAPIRLAKVVWHWVSFLYLFKQSDDLCKKALAENLEISRAEPALAHKDKLKRAEYSCQLYWLSFQKCLLACAHLGSISLDILEHSTAH